ncbi:MAG: dihydroneopterin aldolase [Myxococcota bacterium]
MADRIHIDGLTVDCVVGVYPHERNRAQPLVVDLDLAVDTRRAAEQEKLSATLDYARVAAQIDFVLRSCRFRLLETAAHVLAKVLLLPPPPGRRRAQVERVRLRLTKPDALRGQGVPSLEVEREAGFAAYGYEQKPFGTVDVVHETRDAGVYRLNVSPGRSIPLHVHRTMDEAEMVLTQGLHVQDRPVRAGTVHRWPHDVPHRYHNPSDKTQSILCVDSPPFTEEDEIAVEGEPTPVEPVHPGLLR